MQSQCDCVWCLPLFLSLMYEADLVIAVFFPSESRLCLRILYNEVILEDITRPQELARKMSPTWQSHSRMYMGYLFLFREIKYMEISIYTLELS